MSERHGLVGPQHPVGELFEGRAACRVDEDVVGDAAGVHAGAAQADLGAVLRGGDEHPVEVVVAVRNGLAFDGATDRVAQAEDSHGGAVAFGDGAGEAEPVEGAFVAVGGTSERGRFEIRRWRGAPGVPESRRESVGRERPR